MGSWGWEHGEPALGTGCTPFASMGLLCQSENTHGSAEIDLLSQTDLYVCSKKGLLTSLKTEGGEERRNISTRGW